MAPCPPRLHPDPSRSERAKMVLKERMEIVTAHFLSSISPRESHPFPEVLGESPTRGSRRASQPHSTAGFVSKEVVPETQPHQPSPGIFQTHPHEPFQDHPGEMTPSTTSGATGKDTGSWAQVPAQILADSVP